MYSLGQYAAIFIRVVLGEGYLGQVGDDLEEVGDEEEEGEDDLIGRAAGCGMEAAARVMTPKLI